MFASASLIFLGFGALAVDMSLVRLADAEIQAVADAAAQAALLRLRATTSRSHAAEVTAQLVASNRVAGSTPTLTKLEFGVFDDGAFVESGLRANAVRVRVRSVTPLTFANFWGMPSVPVSASATVATRSLHAIVVMDITNSWSWEDFEGGRAGAVAVFDQITGTGGEDDRIGMVVFTGQFGVEFSPLTQIDDAVFDLMRDDWANMRTASKAGTPNQNNGSCSLKSGASENDFTNPDGGCYANMPREYRDEYGTDHAVGIEMAVDMFEAEPDPSVYRAMIILTDGEPNGTGPHQQRIDAGFDEKRWRYTFAGKRRGTAEVKSESIAWAVTAHDTSEINVWTVSYKADAAWLSNVAQGDGYYVRAFDSDDLAPIFEDIVESLPVALVE